MTKEEFEKYIKSIDEKLNNLSKANDNKELFASDNVVNEYKQTLSDYSSLLKQNQELENTIVKYSKDLEDKNKIIETVKNTQRDKFFEKAIEEGRIKKDDLSKYTEMYSKAGADLTIELIEKLPAKNADLNKELASGNGVENYSFEGYKFKDKKEHDDFVEITKIFSKEEAIDILGLKKGKEA